MSARSRARSFPKGVGYSIPMPMKLLESAALAVLPLRSRRALDRLMIAWCGEAGTANGDLLAPYDVLKQGGQKETILDSLVDLQAVGLIQVNRGARSYGTRQAPSRYRLTWLPTPNGMPPTNEWLGLTTEEAEKRLAKAREGLAAERAERRARRRPRKTKPTPPQRRDGADAVAA